ncbi:MAG: hypothetical protein C7B47_17815 [Sulfobacillus thermosulfidooxidans]|uniref:Uncharacterized protein n=1 Tax=Sulfobacillus thermosulfidooxidans TaxID=28034 RepID=A0A2T2WEN6_SULTH|nr:MAG: hypothetical protein C7B47_17815 [Sulfobacillus thermosulfidooxidans]
MAITITALLDCDNDHPWDSPSVTIPPRANIDLFLKDWMLQHGWSIDTSHADHPRMLCPACTYQRLLKEGYDGVFS